MPHKRPTPAAAAPRPNRAGLPLHVYLDPALRKAIGDLAARTRRSLTAEVSIAVECHLEASGLWPPPATPDAG